MSRRVSCKPLPGCHEWCRNGCREKCCHLCHEGVTNGFREGAVSHAAVTATGRVTRDLWSAERRLVVSSLQRGETTARNPPPTAGGAGDAGRRVTTRCNRSPPEKPRPGPSAAALHRGGVHHSTHHPTTAPRQNPGSPPVKRIASRFTAPPLLRILEGVGFPAAPSPPSLLIEGHAPDLTGDQRRVLADQWQRFWAVRRNGSRDVRHLDGIPAGGLLHHTRYTSASLSETLRSGVLSGEIGYSGKELMPEDAETHYSADFFCIEQEKTVSQYVEFCHEPIKVGRLRVKRPEQFAAPGPRSSSIDFVFPPSRPRELLLERSATASSLAVSELRDWPMRFPLDGGREGGERHVAVLVGRQMSARRSSLEVVCWLTIGCWESSRLSSETRAFLLMLSIRMESTSWRLVDWRMRSAQAGQLPCPLILGRGRGAGGSPQVLDRGQRPGSGCLVPPQRGEIAWRWSIRPLLRK